VAGRSAVVVLPYMVAGGRVHKRHGMGQGAVQQGLGEGMARHVLVPR